MGRILQAVGFGLWLTWSSGCEVGTPFDRPMAAAWDDTSAERRDAVLQWVGGNDGLALHVAEGREVAVLLRNSKSEYLLAGEPVSFALQGDTGGASLKELEVSTDADGIARSFLSAGPTPAEFRLRANATGAQPLFVEVNVQERGPLTLEIDLAYDGLRAIQDTELRVYAGTGCATPPTAPPSVADTSSGTLLGAKLVEQGTTTARLEIASHEGLIAVQARAFNLLGGTAALGCTEGIAPVEALTVVLEDLPLQMQGTYAVSAKITADDSSGRLAAALRASVPTVLDDPNAPSGRRMLSAVEDALREQGDHESAADVAALSAPSEEPSPAQALEQKLTDDDRGLAQAMELLAQQLQARGAALEVRAELQATNADPLDLTYTPTALFSIGEEDQEPLPLWSRQRPSTFDVGGTVLAQLDSGVGLLQIDELTIELGAGRYGRLLLDALATSVDSEMHQRLLEVAGCSELADWVSAQTELATLCGKTCRSDACDLAIEDLIRDAGTQLASLNTNHPTLELRGNVPVYDLNGDGVADRITSTPLLGSWGEAAEAQSADPIHATLEASKLSGW